MGEFRVPDDVGNPSALEVQSAGRFCASTDLPSAREESQDKLNDRLDTVGARLSDGEADALAEQDNFEDIFCLVRDFKYLPSKVKGRVLDLLHASVRTTVNALRSHRSRSGKRRCASGGGEDDIQGDDGEQSDMEEGQAAVPLLNAYKMAVYLMFLAAFPAEECYFSAKQTEILEKPSRGKGSRGGRKTSAVFSNDGSFKWEDARGAVLESMRLALTVDTSRLWRQGIPDRAFVGLFLRLSCKMLELPETVKNGRQAELALELLSEPFHQAPGMESEFSAAVFLLVRENRHLAEPVAKLCWLLVERHGDARLGGELVREIGRMDMPDVTSKNTAAAAPIVNVSDFLRELVQLLPGTVHAHASVVLPLLSSRSYHIRNAVVFSVGEMLTLASEGKGAETGQERTAASFAGSTAAEGWTTGDDQVQTDPRRVRMKDRNRDDLLDCLVERALDVSPFVRVAVLRAWGVIAERQALPRKRFLNAARVCADRLRDQSSLVRKEAVKSLQHLMAYNPYNGTLDLSVNELRFKQAAAELRAMTPPASASHGQSDATDTADASTTSGGSRKDGQGEDADATGSDESDDDEGSEGNSDHPEEEDGVEKAARAAAEVESTGTSGEGSSSSEALSTLVQGREDDEGARAYTAKIAQCDSLSEAILFVKDLQAASTVLSAMLGSTITSDVVEALRFFVMACHFQLPGAMAAIKKGLALIWRTEASIEAEIKNAFAQVFVSRTIEGVQEMLPAQAVVRNLVNLVNDSRVGELASLEEVVASLVRDSRDPDKDVVLDSEVFEQLWCAVGTKGQLPRGRAGALHAIAMGATADPSLVNDPQRLEVVRETALGRVTMEARDWRTVRCACIALLRCDPVALSGSKEAELILTRLSYFLQGKWCAEMTEASTHEERVSAEKETRDWFAAAEQAVAVVFHLHRAPETVGGAIVRRLAAHTLSSDVACPLSMARLCFVLGHLALKLLVHSEDLAGKVERARAKVKLPESAVPSGGKGQKKRDEEEGQDEDEDATAQELGLSAEASAEDEQRLAELVEKEIVGRNLLGVFGPLLVRLVADEDGAFGHSLVRESSVLALSKFMCISESFCERHLSLLFTTLDRSEETAVRTNIVVAFGDLAFRFPNALEPWNSRVYDRLKDNCPRVRANAIMVLTHLILNDMVKVKSHVSGLAVCMVDNDPRIRDAAKVFFHKYAERGANPIYNVLPDIVGRLSVDEALSSVEYQEIMGSLMQYVKKEKLTELLAEKLVARLVASETSRQDRRVSYTLGQLKVTEKAVNRMVELVPTYKGKLQDAEVFANFMGVVNRAKQFASQEMTHAVDEWKTQLQKFHEGEAENAEAEARAARAANKRRERRVSARASVSSTASASGMRAEDGGNAARSRRCQKPKQRRAIVSDSESEGNLPRGTESSDDDSSSSGASVHLAGSKARRKTSKTDHGDTRTRGRGSQAQCGHPGGDVESEVDFDSEEDVFEPKRRRMKPKAKAKENNDSKENRATSTSSGYHEGTGRSRKASPLSPAN